MKPRRQKRNIFQSNLFLLCFSLVLSVAVWLVASILVAPEEKRTIAHVPVSIELNDAVKNLNLQAYTPEEGLFVDVIVRGKRYDLAAIVPSDLTVRATPASVGSAGQKTLRLTATGGIGSAFTVELISPQEISVLFDENKEQVFQMSTQLLDKNGKVLKDLQSVAPEGYTVGHELLSKSTVTLSGPASEIARVKSVVATAQIAGKIDDDAAFPVNISVETEGAAPQFVSAQYDDITLTVPVYKKVTLPATVDWLNVPPAYAKKALPITVSPQKALFGVSESQLAETTAVSVGTIDFADIPAGYKKTFTFPASEVLKFPVVDAKVKNFYVTVDTSGKVSRRFAVPHSNIQLRGAKEGVHLQPAAGALASVTVAGGKDSLEKITAADIYAELDLANIKPNEGNATQSDTSLPAHVFVKGFDDCWIIGNYKVLLTQAAE
ncbi:MAG: hypothetical protein LBN05_03360 [Oscillospiraceae bacterium]|jgi:YbbR domain-containing protein|nr:hypothetical protein [Oscillospiraceae bacterium]